jgi:CRISPR system Cascade subunit CasB
MTGFIKWLEELNGNDRRVRAVLRRSLAFEPGTFPAAYPYVEWSLPDSAGAWHRKVQYLVAGLWAQHWREGRHDALPIGKAGASLRSSSSGSDSTERRFIALLDSDSDQLPHRLRQIVALLKDYPLDFEALRLGLLAWNDDRRLTQQRWARDFYRTVNDTHDSNATSIEEAVQ